MRFLVEVLVETDTLSNADLVELVESELKICSECSVESVLVKRLKGVGQK